MKEQALGSCLHTPELRGVEGFLYSTSKQEVEQAHTTGNRPTRGFNAPTPHHDTADTSLQTINFEDFLMRDDLTAADTSMEEMIENAMFALPEPEVSTTDHFTFSLAAAEVWAPTTFEDPAIGLCLPAAEAEGGRVELPVEIEDVEDSDLLQWLMDDTQIGGFALPQEAEATTPAFLVEVLEEEETSVKVKTETLTEEEKYRRMRDQNNRASQACRAKRKRALAAQEEEVEELQGRNKKLRLTLDTMEREVAQLKSMMLEQVAQRARK